MKVSFRTAYLAELYEKPLSMIRGKHKFPLPIIKQYKKVVSILMRVENLNELKVSKSLNLEALRGNRQGQMSLRLNIQYRLIITKVDNDELSIYIEEISKHYE